MVAERRRQSVRSREGSEEGLGRRGTRSALLVGDTADSWHRALLTGWEVGSLGKEIHTP